MSRYLYSFLQTSWNDQVSSATLHLIASFVGALEKFTSLSKAKMEILFPNIATTKKATLVSILEKLAQCHVRREQVRRFDIN